MSFSRDIQILNERYGYIVNEDNSQVPPEAKRSFEEAVRKLAEKAVDGDKEAIEILTNPKKAEELINQAAKQSNESPTQEVTTEAFERFRAKLGAKLTGSDPILNRYNLFLADINGHLWEIDKDSKLLNVEPKEVNQFISDIVSIEPGVDKQGKLLQKIGYGIGRTVGAAMFAAPFAIAVSHFAPLIGIYGIAAKAIAAGLAGGGKTVTILNNKQLSRDEKIGEIIKVAGLAFAMTYAGAAPSSVGGGGHSGDTGGYSGNTGNDAGSYSTGDEFKELHNTPYDSVSSLDRVKQSVADILRSKGVVGSSGGLDNIASPTIMNAMDTAGVHTTSQYAKVLSGLKGLSVATLKAMQQNPNTAVKTIKSLL